jgi:hypothetical protein
MVPMTPRSAASLGWISRPYVWDSQPTRERTGMAERTFHAGAPMSMPSKLARSTSTWRMPCRPPVEQPE